jgi:hypothetical protein
MPAPRFDTTALYLTRDAFTFNGDRPLMSALRPDTTAAHLVTGIRVRPGCGRFARVFVSRASGGGRLPALSAVPPFLAYGRHLPARLLPLFHAFPRSLPAACSVSHAFTLMRDHPPAPRGAAAGRLPSCLAFGRHHAVARTLVPARLGPRALAGHRSVPAAIASRVARAGRLMPLRGVPWILAFGPRRALSFARAVARGLAAASVVSRLLAWGRRRSAASLRTPSGAFSARLPAGSVSRLVSAPRHIPAYVLVFSRTVAGPVSSHATASVA